MSLLILPGLVAGEGGVRALLLAPERLPVEAGIFLLALGGGEQLPLHLLQLDFILDSLLLLDQLIQLPHQLQLLLPPLLALAHGPLRFLFPLHTVIEDKTDGLASMTVLEFGFLLLSLGLQSDGLAAADSEVGVAGLLAAEVHVPALLAAVAFNSVGKVDLFVL